MITQIYAIKTPEDAIGCIEAGADYIGFMPSFTNDVTLPDQGEIARDVALEIMRVSEGKAVRVAIGIKDEVESFFELARIFKPEVIHISPDNFKTNEEFYKSFKAQFPNIRILQAIAVFDESAIETAVEVAPYCDLIILDSPGKVGIGASGIEHDRAIDREIIKRVSVPVIIAGGLDGENVIDAIKETQPWGVDSMTKTDIFIDGKSTRRKDLEKVRHFCEMAKSVK